MYAQIRGRKKDFNSGSPTDCLPRTNDCTKHLPSLPTLRICCHILGAARLSSSLSLLSNRIDSASPRRGPRNTTVPSAVVLGEYLPKDPDPDLFIGSPEETSGSDVSFVFLYGVSNQTKSPMAPFSCPSTTLRGMKGRSHDHKPRIPDPPALAWRALATASMDSWRSTSSSNFALDAGGLHLIFVTAADMERTCNDSGELTLCLDNVAEF